MCTRRTSMAAAALAAAAALVAWPLLAADASHPVPGKDTGTPRASQPAAAGPGQSKSSDESPQSTDKSTSQGAKASSTGGKAKKKKRATHDAGAAPSTSAAGTTAK
jgi:hypothetical protein